METIRSITTAIEQIRSVLDVSSLYSETNREKVDRVIHAHTRVCETDPGLTFYFKYKAANPEVLKAAQALAAGELFIACRTICDLLEIPEHDPCTMDAAKEYEKEQEEAANEINF